ncbi:MAG: hypothetical protein AB1486_08945 [Planctomycetota bacterium]
MRGRMGAAGGLCCGRGLRDRLSDREQAAGRLALGGQRRIDVTILIRQTTFLEAVHDLQQNAPAIHAPRAPQ